jgi:NADPH2:quinone reductase
MSHSTAAGDIAPATMRAVVVTRPGGLDALEIKDVPAPYASLAGCGSR